MFPLINVLCDYDPFYIPDGYKNGSFQGSVIKLFRLLYHNMIVYTICFLGDGKEIGVFKNGKGTTDFVDRTIQIYCGPEE